MVYVHYNTIFQPCMYIMYAPMDFSQIKAKLSICKKNNQFCIQKIFENLFMAITLNSLL